MKTNRDIDEIIKAVKTKFPTAGIYQLKVTHPADDDGIWYFWLEENTDDEIQVENSYGQCPFLTETNRNNDRKWGNTVEETVNIICEHLKTSRFN